MAHVFVSFRYNFKVMYIIIQKHIQMVSDPNRVCPRFDL